MTCEFHVQFTRASRVSLHFHYCVCVRAATWQKSIEKHNQPTSRLFSFRAVETHFRLPISNATKSTQSIYVEIISFSKHSQSNPMNFDIAFGKFHSIQVPLQERGERWIQFRWEIETLFIFIFVHHINGYENNRSNSQRVERWVETEPRV